MFNFEEALKIARKYKKKINHCVEYTNAYVFSFETGTVTFGGESPVVVLKETGDIMGMTRFAWMPDKEFVGELEVPEP